MAPRTVEHKRHQTDDHQSALFPTSASERVSVATIDHSTAVILDVGTMELKPSPREEELVKFIWNHGGPYQEVESVIARLYAPHKHSSIARSPIEQLRQVNTWISRGTWTGEYFFARQLPLPPLSIGTDGLDPLLVVGCGTEQETWDRYWAVVPSGRRQLFDDIRSRVHGVGGADIRGATWWLFGLQSSIESAIDAIQRGVLPAAILAAALAMFSEWPLAACLNE